MTLPARITIVRHGESEANVAQKLTKAGRGEELPLAAYDARHDAYMRLTPEGVKQAESAGHWLYAEAAREMKVAGLVPHAGFDRFYTSPHIRTKETALHLDLGGEWREEDRLRERDWGQVVSHRMMDDDTKRVRNLHEWYWKPQGGESLATGLRGRVESLMTSFYRRKDVENIILVGHGEVIRVFQFVVERLSPESFLEQEEDPSKKIQNTMIVQYACINPLDPEDNYRHSHYKWRRAICPWDRSLDWDNGEWVSVDIKKKSDKDLLESVEKFPRLLAEFDEKKKVKGSKFFAVVSYAVNPRHILIDLKAARLRRAVSRDPNKWF